MSENDLDALIYDLNRHADWIKSLQDGQPCDHPSCLSHVSHPCEGCGRIAGRRGYTPISVSTVFTGKLYSFGGRQFRTTTPDGTVKETWSPPWSEDSMEQQAAAVLVLSALEYAAKMGVDVDGLLEANVGKDEAELEGGSLRTG